MLPELAGLTGARTLIAIGVGFGAGALNNLTAGGALFSYSMLLSFGYSPILATITNTAGLTPGSVSGAVGYRKELRGETSDGKPPLRFREAVFLALVACIGGYTGAGLLMMLPPGDFSHILPWLIGGACFLILANTQRRRLRRLMARLRNRRSSSQDQPPAQPGHRHGQHTRRQLWAWPGVLAAATYGGFFAAGQGVVFVSMLSVARSWGLQRILAFKQVLTSSTNAAATAMFAIMAHPEWRVAALIAAGSLPGGWVGARISRWMPAVVLQVIILAAAGYGIYHATA